MIWNELILVGVEVVPTVKDALFRDFDFQSFKAFLEIIEWESVVSVHIEEDERLRDWFKPFFQLNPN